MDVRRGASSGAGIMASEFVHCVLDHVTSGMRKPGEPIYLRIHLIALALVLLATVAVPRVAEFFVGPLGFGTHALVGLGIAVIGGLALYRLYNSSARNEP